MSEMRHVLDVSELPHGALDHRSPIWWGNVLLLFIETTMFGILVAAYFYVRLNFEQWPPVQPNFFPPNFDPVPDLAASIVNLVVLGAACGAMLLADRKALKMNARGVNIGLIAGLVLGLGSIALRSVEFHALKFRWDDNAYGSLVWFIVGMHLAHLIVGVCETAIMLAWVLTHGLDDKHARDVRVTAIYWYWIGAVWLVLWAIVFAGPRFF